MPKNKKIYIAVLNQGWIRPELTDLIVSLKGTNLYYLYITYPAKKPITNNRNDVVGKFLDTDADFLLMIDGDNVPPQDIIKLADYNKPVIGGMCFGYMDNNLIPFCMEKNKEGMYDIADVYVGEGVKEVDAIGSGVMMIRRDVLEEVPKPFENTYDAFGKKIKGLDFHFCEKAKKKGYKIYCNTDMPCSHWTTIDLKNSWQTFNQLFQEVKKLRDEINNYRKRGSGDSTEPSSQKDLPDKANR